VRETISFNITLKKCPLYVRAPSLQKSYTVYPNDDPIVLEIKFQDPVTCGGLTYSLSFETDETELNLDTLFRMMMPETMQDGVTLEIL